MSKTRALGKPSLVRRLVPRRLTLRGGLLVLVLACALLCSVSPVLAAETSARTAEDIQARWVQLMPSFVFDRGPDSRYITLPSFHAPYQAGSLAPAYLQDGINYLNYVRYLAGLPDDVTLDASYNTLAQHGAVLSWVGGIGLTHTPTKPADMDQAFYDLGLRGTRSSNIASGGGLRGAIEAFMCDDDPSNISRVGHRRWLLNPAMQKTGMGDAHSVLVYAHDRSRPEDVPYDVIAWPSAGLFPVEMFSAVQGWPEYADPWSITLNPALYWWTEGAAGHTITLQRRGDGRTWTFTSADTDLSGEYFTLDTTAFGVANCFIFRPDQRRSPCTKSAISSTSRCPVASFTRATTAPPPSPTPPSSWPSTCSATPWRSRSTTEPSTIWPKPAWSPVTRTVPSSPTIRCCVPSSPRWPRSAWTLQ